MQQILKRNGLVSRTVLIGSQNQIFCIDTDEHCKQVILLIHGYGGFSFYFIDLIHSLRDRFRCIAIDVPGTGLSKCQKYLQSYQSAQIVQQFYIPRIKAFIDEYLSSKKIRIIGHSYGGYLSGIFAMRYPSYVLKLFLLSPISGQVVLSTLKRVALKLTQYLQLSPQYFLRYSFGHQTVYNTLKMTFNSAQLKKQWDQYLTSLSKNKWNSQQLFPYVFTQSGIAKLKLSLALQLASHMKVQVNIFFGDRDWMSSEWAKDVKSPFNYYLLKNTTHQVQINPDLYKYIF